MAQWVQKPPATGGRLIYGWDEEAQVVRVVAVDSQGRIVLSGTVTGGEQAVVAQIVDKDGNYLKLTDAGALPLQLEDFQGNYLIINDDGSLNVKYAGLNEYKTPRTISYPFTTELSNYNLWTPTSSTRIALCGITCSSNQQLHITLKTTSETVFGPHVSPAGAGFSVSSGVCPIWVGDLDESLLLDVTAESPGDPIDATITVWGYEERPARKIFSDHKAAWTVS